MTLAIGTTRPGTWAGTANGRAVNAGVATFNNLSVNKSGSGYTLTAVDGSLPVATSTGFNITAATADHLVFSIQPGNTTGRSPISPSVTVQVLDALGNLVTTDTSNVTLAIGTNPGGGASAAPHGGGRRGASPPSATCRSTRPARVTP